ncbi:hypothetical protein [Arthrobacter sp. Alg241-R88]|uniref:hypothetical protein n=1 Tax=Arthrobacter sp. Alg241-R88 TaxID=2305984 RepID=UPI0013D45342|nr:hypothetical protein [Arthrobacter sp. Alg241-R88]
MPDLLTGGLTATVDDRIDEAEALVRSFCGWHIAPSVEATASVMPAGRILALPSLYVTSIEGVSADEVPLEVDTHYTWSTAGVITHAGTWSCNTPVVVEFTHGYENCPAEILSVIRAVAQRSVSNPASALRDQAGPFAVQHSTSATGQAATLSLLDAEKDILRRYRIPTVA